MHNLRHMQFWVVFCGMSCNVLYVLFFCGTSCDVLLYYFFLILSFMPNFNTMNIIFKTLLHFNIQKNKTLRWQRNKNKTKAMTKFIIIEWIHLIHLNMFLFTGIFYIKQLCIIFYTLCAQMWNLIHCNRILYIEWNVLGLCFFLSIQEIYKNIIFYILK